jgi:two-component system response regulator RegA
MSDSAAAPLILAVDDDELGRSLLEAVLLRAGYRVVAASSAQLALSLAGQFHPAAAVCDVRLVDSDGFKVARALTTEFEPPIPVILLTGYPAPGDAEAAEASGAAALLPKSRNRDVLLATLAALLAGSSGGPAQRAG